MVQDADSSTDVWERRKKQAMTILGGVINKMPVRFWEENMLFAEVQNTWWRLKTRTFPATHYTSGSHPLFVLKKEGNQSFQICPCSSKGNRSRYIRKGCTLLQTRKVTDQNSFLVEKFSYRLPISVTFSVQPKFLGQVPEKCINGARQ